MSNGEIIVGIDLGTTNSVLAYMDGDKPVVIPNQEGNLTTPSMVTYQNDGAVVVGQIAKRQAISNAANTIFSAKRLIGKKYMDLTEHEKRLPFKVTANSNGDAVIEVDGKNITPQEVGSHILRKLVKAAEDYLGCPVKRAVISVPAFFGDQERQATKQAGEIIGLEVMRVAAEPTMAALAYGSNKNGNGVCVVADVGGGTTDLSLVEIDSDTVEVLATSGNVHLGGDNVDESIIDWMIGEFKNNTGINLGDDKMALQRLKEAAEKAKCELSSMQSTDINLPFITATSTGPQHLNLTLSRAKFEQMIEGFVESVLTCCKKVMQDAGKDKSELKEVLLVGGSCRIPYLQDKLQTFFGKKLNKSINFDLAIAEGAAIQGGILAGDVKGLLLLDVTPLTLSIMTLGEISSPIIERNTTIPTKKSQIFSTAADNQTSVEVVVLQGERKFAKDNRLLGRFHLDGIPSAPRGVPQIEVEYDIDANGILSVHAKDKATGKEQKITITASSGLSKEDISRMTEEAAMYEEEDKKRAEQISTRNDADTFVYSVEKTLNENSEKIPEDVKSDVRIKIETLKEAIKTDDYEAMKVGKDELMKASFKMSDALYKNTEPMPPPQEPTITDAEVMS